VRVQATAIRACEHSTVLGSRAWTSAAQAGEMMSTNHLVTIVSTMSTRSSKYGPGNVHSSAASCGAGAGRPLGISVRLERGQQLCHTPFSLTRPLTSLPTGL
jgi:hypothetical protein